ISSKLDLLVRVRYSNPLIAPPYPPKLFNVPTNISRLGEPSYLDHLSSSAPIPMLVDSEMGMPIDLNAYDGVWDGNDEILNPTFDPNKVKDETDLALLIPFHAPVVTNGVEQANTTRDYSWMRNSNYSMRKNAAKRRSAMDTKGDIDASEAAQIMAIDKTFSDLEETQIDALRHPDPNKRDLRVVETYDILPDAERWGDPYLLMRYPEKPSAATATNPQADASNRRLARALLRPVEDEEQQRYIIYLLPREEDLDKLDESIEHPLAEEQLIKLQEGEEEGEQDEKPKPGFLYERIRLYDVVSQVAPHKEILVTFHEGEEDDENGKKRKGVLYNNIVMRSTVRKKIKRTDEPESGEHWNRANIIFRQPKESEMEFHAEASEVIVDPHWANGELRRLHGGDNMAEGQGEAIDDEEDPIDEGAEAAEDVNEGEDA
ncbi:hypothetical protein TREMEDRAFT_32136, partial [Tremella mesenterica DSM 1558]|uniref:uncharacterized protein n=1 Tax=Tremella mesenterica (strain ATCC 24925 / CBS 8224 / DSM 1558 / NBRC 9311 / NRRL Y-6157 / RJB 2259-6 / UBC 559-6) TaxID=578456 RepID=UPI0003F48D4C